MPTKSQIEASRRNGAKSHGPLTPEGKQCSSQNALKYSLSARTVVLCTKSHQLFSELEQGYIDSLQPTTLLELHLVQRIAVAPGPSKPPSPINPWRTAKSKTTANVATSTTTSASASTKLTSTKKPPPSKMPSPALNAANPAPLPSSIASANSVPLTPNPFKSLARTSPPPGATPPNPSRNSPIRTTNPPSHHASSTIHPQTHSKTTTPRPTCVALHRIGISRRYTL
jgi:hypothetical protein